MADEITREEQFMSAAAGNEVNLPDPITREEMLLAKAAGMDIDLTKFAVVTRKEMYLKKIADNGGGGGSSVDVEPLSVTQNGEYTAEEGKAYSPVTVNVPNTYAAGDEGKVVSGGALVAQTAHATVTENGTIDTTLNNSVVVDVPSGGGGSNYTLLKSQEFEVSTDSTTEVNVATYFTVPFSTYPWSAAKIIYVKIRDKAGPRVGYFVGSDTFIFNTNAQNNDTTTSVRTLARIYHVCVAEGVFSSMVSSLPQSNSAEYGIYVNNIGTFYQNMNLPLKAKYNPDTSRPTGIIDGTYVAEVYALDYAPNQGNPYNYSYPANN